MSSSLHIEPIAPESVLRESADKEDLSLVEGFASEHRRREVLAWRAIVKRELGRGVKISHDENGAPQVDTPETYISVSHSKELVAVMLSDRPCAVDIESTARDFRKVAKHYLTEEEMALAEQYDIFAEMWSAKESLYKYYRKGGLNYLCDVKITGYDGAGCLQAALPDVEHIDIEVERRDGYIVATIE